MNFSSGKVMLYSIIILGVCLLFTHQAEASIYDEASSYWNFDETSGTVAVDSNGGHNGTLLNGAGWTTAGKVKGALLLDGVNDYVQMGDSSSFDNTNQMTISFWANPSIADGSPRGLISKRITWNDQDAYSIFTWNDNRLYADVDDNNNRFATNIVFTPNTWYNITMVYDGTLTESERVKMYLDGNLVYTASESSTSIPDYASDLTIGTMNAGYYVTFGGKIDEVAIWRRALTNTEVMDVATTAPEPSILGMFAMLMMGMWIKRTFQRVKVIPLLS